MHSQRINGKGKEVSSPAPFRTLAEEWDAAQQGRHSMWPHPSCNDDDCGTITSPVDQTTYVQKSTTWLDGRDYSGNHVPEDYDRYLQKVAIFGVGDYIVYKWHKENDPMLQMAAIRCILFKMPREEMTWPRAQGFPKPFIVMNCGYLDKPAEKAYVSYEDLGEFRLLNAEEFDTHIQHNVQLPNYIQQVKDAIKARTCLVTG